MGLDRRGQRRYVAPETIAALEALPLGELAALHDAMAELEADVLVTYDAGDDSIDHDAEDAFALRTPPTGVAFPPVTSDFAAAFTAHVESLPRRWRIDGAAIAYEVVGSVLAPQLARERARRAATWRTTARRQRGSRRTRRH
jgi:hypothetical protein